MCKESKYGNCDEETKNNEYCIFHKPDKSEEEAREFWRKFLERFKPVRETIKVEDFEVEMFVFEGDVYCNGYAFPEIPDDVNFSFKYIIFKRDVSFLNVTFSKGVSFWGANFEKDVSFESADFKGNVSFWKADFKGNVSFWGANFNGDVSFWRVNFEKDVSFWRVKFKGNVSFGGANFEKDVSFESADFKGNVSFEEAKFKGDVSFEKANFEKDVSFTNKQKEGGCNFYGMLNFSSINFKAIKIDIPSKCFKHPQAEVEACRIQRVNYEKEGMKNKADELFIRERRALRRWKRFEALKELKGLIKNEEEKLKIKETSTELKKRKLKQELKKVKLILKLTGKVFAVYVSSIVEYFFVDFTCKYGTNWMRPIILWFVLVIFVFPITYFLTHSVSGIHGAKVGSIWNYLYFSVVTATTLGYGDLHPIGWGKAIASAEAIFGMFMWAVFLAVFSRKYMR